MARPSGPICCKCHVEMYPETNGVSVVTYAHNPPEPYEIYQGDRWACRVCGVRVVTGLAQNPIAIRDNTTKLSDVFDQVTRAYLRVDCFEHSKG